MNYEEFYTTLANEVRITSSFPTSLNRLLCWGAQAVPHPSWEILKAYDYSEEVSRVEPWIKRVLKRAPCPFPIRAIYFGLGERANHKRVEYAELYFGLFSRYDSADQKSGWLWTKPSHYPNRAYLLSKTLQAGGVLCNEDEENGLGTDGHIIFSLGFSALLLANALDGRIAAQLGGETVGLVLGFDSGDLIRLGELACGGFVANQSQMVG
jgi:hypothetical protein